MIEYLTAAILIGIAAFRAWRIVALDQITEPIRAKLIAAPGRFWSFVLDLVGCAWCLGWWIAGVLTLLITLTLGWGWLVFALVWLASSGVAGIAANWSTREPE